MTLLDAMYAPWIVTIAPRGFEVIESGGDDTFRRALRVSAGAAKEISSEFNERATNDNFFS
jgi:hypothetical protein